MLNLETLRVLITRNVIWLKIMYFAPTKVTQGPLFEYIDNGNNNTIKAGESVGKFIFNGDDGVNSLTHVESDADGITHGDGNVKGNTQSGDDTTDPTSTDENTNEDGDQWQQVTTTKSGRVSVQGKNLSQNQAKELGLTSTQTNYYALVSEDSKEEFAPGKINCVGAVLGGGFTNMHELHVMKYDQAMAGPDSEQ